MLKRQSGHVRLQLPTQTTASAIKVEVIAVIASSEIYQNVSVVWPDFLQLQVTIVLPNKHRLVSQTSNLLILVGPSRMVSVDESEWWKWNWIKRTSLKARKIFLIKFQFLISCFLWKCCSINASALLWCFATKVVDTKVSLVFPTHLLNIYHSFTSLKEVVIVCHSLFRFSFHQSPSARFTLCNQSWRWRQIDAYARRSTSSRRRRGKGSEICIGQWIIIRM